MFPNYAGAVETSAGIVPLSYPELSRPTGRYVSVWLMRELNLLLRRHAVVMTGNTCLPGIGLPKIEESEWIRQFNNHRPGDCRVLVSNFMGTPSGSDSVQFKAEPFMDLAIRPEWHEFNDYLNSLSSRYRTRARHALQSSAALGKRVFTPDQLGADDFRFCADSLRLTLRRKTLMMNKDLGSVLNCFAGHFQDAFKIIIYYENGHPISFISFTVQNNEMHAWHMGYHADKAKSFHLYQRMMYDLVEQAIHLQCNTLHMGRTATEIKSTIGAVPIENYYSVYTNVRILRSLLKGYQSRIYKPKSYIIRSPFKSK